MAMHGTIAGFPQPLFSNQFTFAVTTILTVEHANSYITVNATAAPVTMSLPPAGSCSRGTFIWFAQVSINNVTYQVQAGSGDTVNRVAGPFVNGGVDPIGALAILETPTNWNLILHV